MESVVELEKIDQVRRECSLARVRGYITDRSLPEVIPVQVEADSTGLLVKPGDPRGLAGAIRRYLDQPELMAVHGAAGRARVEKQFSLAKMVAGYLAVYDSRQDTSLQMNGE